MKIETILITGASRGIGCGIACYLAKHMPGRYHFLLTCHTRMNKLQKIQQEIISYGNQCEIFTCDVEDVTDINQLWDSIHTKGYSVDILINNAGISIVGLFQDTSADDWNHIIHTNLSSVFFMSKQAVPDMIQQKYGRIINISSVWGNVGASCEVAYSTTKGGINAFTKALGKELAPSNISVNAIACGAVDTEMNRFLSANDRLSLEEEIPYGRFCLPEEVGQCVASLLTAPVYLTSQIITLDGGWI